MTLKRQWSGLTSLIPLHAPSHLPSVYHLAQSGTRHMTTPTSSPSTTNPLLPLRFPRSRTSSTKSPTATRSRSRFATTLSSTTSNPSSTCGAFDSIPAYNHPSSWGRDENQHDRAVLKRLGITDVPGRGIPLYTDQLFPDVQGVQRASDRSGRARNNISSAQTGRTPVSDPERYSSEKRDPATILGIVHVPGRGVPFLPLPGTGASASGMLSYPLFEGWNRFGSNEGIGNNLSAETRGRYEAAGQDEQGNESRRDGDGGNDLEFDLDQVGGYWVKPPLVARALRELELEWGMGTRYRDGGDESASGGPEEGEGVRDVWKVDQRIEGLEGMVLRSASGLSVSQDQTRDMDVEITVGTPSSNITPTTLRPNRSQPPILHPALKPLLHHLSVAGYARSSTSRSDTQSKRENKESQRLLRESISSLRADQAYAEVLREIPLGMVRNLLRSMFAYSRPEQGLEFLNDISTLSSERQDFFRAGLSELTRWSDRFGPPGEFVVGRNDPVRKAYEEAGPGRKMIVRRVLGMSLQLGRRLEVGTVDGKQRFDTVGQWGLKGPTLKLILEGFVSVSQADQRGLGLASADSEVVVRCLRGYVSTHAGEALNPKQVQARWLAIRTLACLLRREAWDAAEGAIAILAEVGWIRPIALRRDLPPADRLVSAFTDLITELVSWSDYALAAQISGTGQKVIGTLTPATSTARWRVAVESMIASCIAANNTDGLDGICEFLRTSNYARHELSSTSPRLPVSLLDALYEANGKRRSKTNSRLYFALAPYGYPPPSGRSLLYLVDSLVRDDHPRIAKLVEGVRHHRDCLHPVHVPDFIISLARSKAPELAKSFYETILGRSGYENQRTADALKRDPDVMLYLSRAFGKRRSDAVDKDGQEPRDRPFANLVIRNYVLASPPVTDLTADALTDLERAFIMVEAPKSAFQILEHVAASHRGPTRRDLMVLLSSVVQKDPEAGLKLIRLAIQKNAIPAKEDRQEILKAFQRLHGAEHAEAASLLAE